MIAVPCMTCWQVRNTSSSVERRPVAAAGEDRLAGPQPRLPVAVGDRHAAQLALLDRAREQVQDAVVRDRRRLERHRAGQRRVVGVDERVGQRVVGIGEHRVHARRLEHRRRLAHGRGRVDRQAGRADPLDRQMRLHDRERVLVPEPDAPADQALRGERPREPVDAFVELAAGPRPAARQRERGRITERPSAARAAPRAGPSRRPARSAARTRTRPGPAAARRRPTVVRIAATSSSDAAPGSLSRTAATTSSSTPTTPQFATAPWRSSSAST